MTYVLQYLLLMAFYLMHMAIYIWIPSKVVSNLVLKSTTAALEGITRRLATIHKRSIYSSFDPARGIRDAFL